jgi:hypothetical protein
LVAVVDGHQRSHRGNDMDTDRGCGPMRLWRLRLGYATWLLAGLCVVPASLAARADVASWQTDGTRSAVLERACQASGGSARQGSIKGLVVLGEAQLAPTEEKRAFRLALLLPDRYMRSIEPEPAGRITVPLVYAYDAGHAWEGKAQRTVTMPIEVRHRQEWLRMALALLPCTRPSADLHFREEGTFVFHGAAVVGIAVNDGTIDLGTMLVDAQTALVRGWSYQRVNPVGQQVTQEYRFDNHKVVEGLRLPYAIMIDGSTSRYEVGSYDLRPHLVPGDFSQGK